MHFNPTKKIDTTNMVPKLYSLNCNQPVININSSMEVHPWFQMHVQAIQDIQLQAKMWFQINTKMVLKFFWLP